MEINHEQTRFMFVIDNFSEKEAVYVISSPIFESGGCEWFVRVHPKGCQIGRHDHLSVFLFALKPESLRSGWKLRADCRFILRNLSGKELKRTSEICFMFSDESPGLGYPQLVPMTKLQEENFLVNNKLMIEIEVQIKVGEIVDGPGEVTRKEMLNFNGFKLDWLETKLEEVSLERKNTIFYCSQVKNLKLELDNEKAKSSAASAKVLLLEKAVSDLKLELEKERSARSDISKVASLKDAAVCFWDTKILGIRQRRAGYRKLD